jgi:hypothetical protein
MLAPLPVLTPVTLAPSALIQPAWSQWINKARDAISLAPQVVGSANLSNQNASLASLLTLGSTPTQATSVYRVSLVLRVATPATTSSSIAWTVAWTDGGVAMTRAGTAVTGNTTTATDTLVFVLRADPSTAITISTTYASTGATAMLYNVDAVVEVLPKALAIP